MKGYAWFLQKDRHLPWTKEKRDETHRLCTSMAVFFTGIAITDATDASQYRLKLMNLEEATGRLLGKPVKTYQGEVLGILQALVGDQMQILYAVLSEPGNTMGLIPISLKATDPYLDGGKVKINVDQRKLKNAPDFRRGNPPDLSDPAWHEATCTYWGIDPIFPRKEYRIVVSPELR
jgi:hypothetical protein